jgi:hypothetical protein
MGKLETGAVVLVQRKPEGPVSRAVVLEVAPNGVVCVSRLTKDGILREERIWTGQWFSVKLDTDLKGGVA